MQLLLNRKVILHNFMNYHYHYHYQSFKFLFKDYY
jgi:hypothetical protein